MTSTQRRGNAPLRAVSAVVLAVAAAAQAVVLARTLAGPEGLASERGAGFHASIPPLLLGLAAFGWLASSRRQLSVFWPGFLFPFVFTAFHLASWGHGVDWYAGELVDRAWALCVFALLAWLCGYAWSRGPGVPVSNTSFTAAGAVLTRPELGRISTAAQVAFVVGLALQLLLLEDYGPASLLLEAYREQKRALAPDVGGLYAYLNSLGTIVCFTSLMLVALACAALHRRVFPNLRFLGLTVAFLALLLLQGDRGGFSLAILPVAIIHHTWVRPVRWREGLALMFVAIALFSGVRGSRESRALEGFVSEATEVAGYGRTIREMGTTLDVVCRAMTLVPDRFDHFAGSTYLWAAARAAPNLSFTPREWGFVSSVWVTQETAPEIYRRRGGLGFSVVAEGYINFGAYGAGLLLFLLGLLHGRAERALTGPRVAFWACAIYLVLEISLINHVRNTAVAYVRGFIWNATILFLVYLAAELSRRRRRAQDAAAADQRLASSARS